MKALIDGRTVTLSAADAAAFEAARPVALPADPVSIGMEALVDLLVQKNLITRAEADANRGRP